MSQDASQDFWDRIQALFDLADEMSEKEREEHFSRCGEAPEILEKVRELLAADRAATAEGFLSPVGPAGRRSTAEEPTIDLEREASTPGSSGERFGPYRTLREIGRGGMSVVHLAERVDGDFEQRVAIKVVASEARERLIERFTRERQILADLNHPHIARLIDGGVGDNGEPYLAMEWVDGLPIDAYCQEKALSVQERLGLLAVVCEAVHAAHQILVVHRDIKPSNVLVDHHGQVKLLDFGIAGLLAPDRMSSDLTRTGHRLLTPQYASPEQLLGQPVGVATDIYQLGLLAYELLAGRRPYDLGEVAPAEAMRLVLEEQPTLPSSAVLEPVAALEGPPQTLHLDGEIDAVVAKALAKRPDQRYGSADLLREDIERYLAGLPISARPPTFGYHLVKFISRHRLGVGLAFGALGVMVVMALVFAQRLVDERDQTRAEAERAERLRNESEEITDFLIGIFEVSDPHSSRGETVTARELLDRGAEQLDQELDAQPLVQARLMNTIAAIYQRLGLFESAERLFAEAGSLREANGAGPLELGASLRGRALVAQKLGRYDEAEEHLQRALELIEEGAPPRHPATGEVLHHIGSLRVQQGQSAEALDFLYRALEILETAGEPEMLAGLFDTLGVTLEDLGRLEEARDLYEKSIALRESIYDTDDPRIAKSLGNLSGLLVQLGQLEGAVVAFERVRDVFEAAYGAGHVDTLTALNNLAIVHKELGHLEEAERLFDSVESGMVSTLGEDHPSLAMVYSNRGNLALESGQGGEAESFYRRSLDLIKASAGDGHPQFYAGLNGLGEALTLQGRRAEASDCFRRAFEGLSTTLGADHLFTSWPALNLARWLDRTGDPAAARPLYEQAAAIRQALDPQSKDRVEAEEALRDFERRHGSGQGPAPSL